MPAPWRCAAANRSDAGWRTVDFEVEVMVLINHEKSSVAVPKLRPPVSVMG
jgi:hypothetical protein